MEEKYQPDATYVDVDDSTRAMDPLNNFDTVGLVSNDEQEVSHSRHISAKHFRISFIFA